MSLYEKSSMICRHSYAVFFVRLLYFHFIHKNIKHKKIRERQRKMLIQWLGGQKKHSHTSFSFLIVVKKNFTYNGH